MPMMDLSVALTNPYTLDTCIVLRRQQVVNNFGEGKMTINRIPNVRGVIYPDGQEGLTREAARQVNAKTIVIITRFALRGESETTDQVQFQPDVIEWNGNQFLVTDVKDYSNFAKGFVQCTCESTDMVDRPTKARE